MSVIEENWQTTRPTIRERSKFMFNNDLFSDVKFVVRKTDGESESKQVIPAHRFVLSISSPVFEAMFYSDLAETRDSIELPDCEYESLMELLRYMYSDEVNLSGSNVMGVFYLAKKYMVPSLVNKCTEYLQDNLDPSNVFSILPSAQKYEEKNLVDRCWELIDEKTEEVVKSDGFETLERSLLEAIVVRDTLTIEEKELFKAVDLWATKECERQGLMAEGKSKRRILGERVLKRMRLVTMKQEDFASVVLGSGILTKEEIVRVIKYFSSVASPPVGFPATQRSGYRGGNHRCCRFGSVSDSCRQYGDNIYDAINFSVDKDIALHGVRLFGTENDTYRVKLEVEYATSKKLLVSKTGQFPSRLLQCEKFSYYGFEVLLDTKEILSKNTTFRLFAKITGHQSLYGVNGVSSVQCRGVIFTFTKSENRVSSATYATNVQHGQFPELLFALK